MNRADQYRAHVGDVEARARDLNVLLQAILDKLDGTNARDSEGVLSAMDAINCFTTCAQRNVALIQDLNEQMTVALSAPTAADEGRA
jgi:hypothetical protein